jgi:hypothetical protein
MKKKTAISTLSRIPINNRLNEKSIDQIKQRLDQCASKLTKLNCQVEVSMGSASSTTVRRNFRIIVEWAGNPSRDSRRSTCYVIDRWDKEIVNKYGYQPFSKTEFFSICDWLESFVDDLKGKRNPIKKPTLPGLPIYTSTVVNCL